MEDTNLLKSALEIPFQTFDGKELYPSTIEKALKLLELVIKNHPFVEGRYNFQEMLKWAEIHIIKNF